MGTRPGGVDLRSLEIGHLENSSEPNSAAAVQCLTLSALAVALHRFDPPWIKVAEVYRRICLLRLEGRDADARRIMESEFAEAEMAAKSACSGDPDADTSLKSFLASEGERVAQAVAFAEVLVPELSRRLSERAGVRPTAAVPAPKPRVASRGDVLPVADFIEEMLAQERAAAG